MIKVKIFRNTDKLVCGFDVTGHASGEHGSNIICSAVSALAQTALLGLGNHLHKQTSYKVESGDMKVQLIDEPDELTSAVLETMILGLTEIMKLNPEEIRLKEYRR